MSAIATLSGATMGGYWRARLPQGYVGSRRLELLNLIQEALDLLEQQLSAWKPSSDLNRLNSSKVGDWVDIPPEFHTVLDFGIEGMKRFPGAFSIFLGGASTLWGFNPGPAKTFSSKPDCIELRDKSARRVYDVCLDLNAIAKGYAADFVGSKLLEAGCPSFMIEVAGDVVAKGMRPDGLPWTVAIELPVTDKSILARLFPVKMGSIATSGGYRRKCEGGCHLISPETGLPLPDLGMVTSIATTGMEAELLSTALYVLGADRGMTKAEENNFPAIFITHNPPHGFVERMTSAANSQLDA